MPNKINFKWEDVEHNLFNDIKRTVAVNILLSYPYSNEKIGINVDAQNYQLGAVIRKGENQ